MLRNGLDGVDVRAAAEKFDMGAQLSGGTGQTHAAVSFTQSAETIGRLMAWLKAQE
jgi:hypothetical protein